MALTRKSSFSFNMVLACAQRKAFMKNYVLQLASTRNQENERTRTWDKVVRRDTLECGPVYDRRQDRNSDEEKNRLNME